MKTSEEIREEIQTKTARLHEHRALLNFINEPSFTEQVEAISDISW